MTAEPRWHAYGSRVCGLRTRQRIEDRAESAVVCIPQEEQNHIKRDAAALGGSDMPSFNGLPRDWIFSVRRREQAETAAYMWMCCDILIRFSPHFYAVNAEKREGVAHSCVARIHPPNRMRYLRAATRLTNSFGEKWQRRYLLLPVLFCV